MLLSKLYPCGCFKNFENTSTHENISKLFFAYGSLVGRHPLPFLLSTLFLNCFLSTGLLYFYEITDVKSVFVPINAPSIHESAAMEEFRSSKETSYVVSALFEAKEENLLTNKSLNEILRISNYLQNDLKINFNGTSYGYNELHRTQFLGGSDFSGNGMFRLVKRLMTEPKYHQNNSLVSLKFPLIRAYGKKIFAPLVLMNVKTDHLDDIESAGIILLRYQLVQQIADSELPADNFLSICHKFANEFESHVLAENKKPHDFKSYAFHLDDLRNEMVKVSQKTLPMLGVSMAMLIIFTLSVGLTTSCVTLKAWESLAGVISALMSVTSAFGLLFYLGYPFMGVLTTVPFLILAIGKENLK